VSYLPFDNTFYLVLINPVSLRLTVLVRSRTKATEFSFSLVLYRIVRNSRIYGRFMYLIIKIITSYVSFNY
jgi:hypothetical protein